MDANRHYQLIEQAIVFLREHQQRQPSLDEIASALHVSPYHLQRTFSEWTGISPKRFLQFLTKEYARAALRNDQNLLDTTLDAGLSSSGRLHELMITTEAMTPGEIRRQGAGMTIHYGLGLTPLGQAIVAWTERGICHLGFIDEDVDSALTQLKQEWSRARLVQIDSEATAILADIFSRPLQSRRLHLLLKGTNFQIKVWEALINTSAERPISYSELAQKIGQPKAQRAIGSAMAANKVGVLIPCHRVIRNNGDVGQYRWGSVRKQALLAWEATRTKTK